MAKYKRTETVKSIGKEIKDEWGTYRPVTLSNGEKYHCTYGDEHYPKNNNNVLIEFAYADDTVLGCIRLPKPMVLNREQLRAVVNLNVTELLTPDDVIPLAKLPK
jgi:hypothetical protein